MKRKARISVLIILILHLVALSSYFLGFFEYILPLTPVNLLITSFLLYTNQKEKNLSFMINSGLIIVFAWIVELIGVKTGLFFGNYEYLGSLGPKIFGTPPIIGFNWWILIIASASFFRKVNLPIVVKALLSSLLMLFIDLWIEPIASGLDFWAWENDEIPLKNYLGWFISGFALQMIYWQGNYKKQNDIGIYVYLIFFAFFVIINLLSA